MREVKALTSKGMTKRIERTVVSMPPTTTMASGRCDCEPMRVESAKGLRLGPAGVEDRQHMRDARLAMEAELVDPTNRDMERHQAL